MSEELENLEGSEIPPETRIAELERQLAAATSLASQREEDARRAFADRDKAKAYSRDMTLKQLQADHPGITAEDIDGLPLDKVQSLLAKTKAPPSEEAPEPPQVEQGEKDQLTKMAAPSGGTPPTVTPITGAELYAKQLTGEISEAQAIEMIQTGKAVID